MINQKLKSLILIPAILLGFFCKTSFAQDEEDEAKIYDKLMALYIAEQYDKLASQAIKFSEKDKYKKSPIPFLFASMAYFEMSNSEKWRDEEPKAFKLAMKYAKKYNRKDKESELYKEFEDSYFTRLREATIGEGMMLVEQEDYRKAMGFFRALTDIDEDDYTAWIMRGYIEFKANMAYNATQSIQEAQKLLAKNPNHDALYPEQKSLLKTGLMFYSEFLNNEGMSDSAKVIIKIGENLFKEDKEYQMVLNENGL
jgi:tetratricopeptide (TPR) repeat protein